MKAIILKAIPLIFSVIFVNADAQTKKPQSAQTDSRKLFIDVHQLEPGKVKYEAVAEAHLKDLAAEKKYGVEFIKYWVDESKGLIYCLSSAPDSASITRTHAEA